MAIKITIDSREVENPVARFLIGLLVTFVIIVAFVLVFFLLLPFIWFAVLSVLFMFVAVLLAAPRIIGTYRVILLRRRSQERGDWHRDQP